MPATVLAVSTSDGIWLGASGTPERGGTVGVTTNARFRVASITKVLRRGDRVATGGRTPARAGRRGPPDYLPDGGVGPVTIRQLLNHTSGIPDYSMSDDFNAGLLKHRERRWTAAELVALWCRSTEPIAPGTDYAILEH